MTSRQTAAICATILLAAMANLAGGFAMKVYFESRQAAFDKQVVRIGNSGLFAEPRLSSNFDAATGGPALQQFDGDAGLDLVPLPPPAVDEDNGGTFIGDGVGQPAQIRSGRAFTPRELTNSELAAPIKPQPLIDERVIASIIKAELPEATAEERAVWLQELKGLGPGEVRNMLNLRRQFGSEIPRAFESPEALVGPPVDAEDAGSSPVAAPVPTGGDEATE
ncbi:MAG: hypothetical protein HON53_18340 [Planctomycetaceae bacterium]|jgi:hypothetical protein|nr:hypothetical protein [Planctomycetaceae bacterium]MBT6155078.1 hypothetical protein [Planctomycetaceae bacterium]MBT6483406.1 hypothetical protein [Planctomycetaceae bacterium]MBT6493799.1 hypothetical protein [Planctomycetaceae bacterium]